MLKYYDLLKNMSIDEKISLLIANKKFVNNKIENYEFPVMDVSNNLFDLSDNYEFLANTWNKNLFKKMGCYTKVVNPNKSSSIAFDNSDCILFSSSYYLSSQIQKYLIVGSKLANGVMVVDALETENLREFCNNFYDDVICEKPFAVLVNAPFIENIKGFYDGLLFVKCNNSLDIVRAISIGKGLILSDESNDSIIFNVNDAINKYNEYKLLLQEGKLDRADFYEFIASGDILSEDMLDIAVDFLLDKLNDYDTLVNIEPSNLIDYKKTIQDVSDESLILLKNTDNILPISDKGSVAIFGYSFENAYDGVSFQSEISKYNLDIIGYSKAVEDNNLDLNAITLAKKAKYLIYFLNNGEDIAINLKALERLKEYNDNIIIVLHSNKLFNIDFYDLAKCLIYYSMPPCKETVNSVLDALVGDLNPSGKISMLVDTSNIYNYEHFIINNKKPLFDLGFGLSYTSFEYSYLRVNKENVSVHIENTSEYDGKELARVYLKRPSDNYFRLIAFEKISLKAHEKSNVVIPISIKSFAVFDQEKNKYEIDGGRYQLIVISSTNDKLETELELTPAILENDDITLDKKTITDEEIAKGFFEGVTNEPKKSRFKIKLISLILVTLYLLACLGVILFEDINNSYAIIGFGSAMAVVVVIFITLLIILIHRHKKEKNYSSGKTLTDYVNQMKEFSSIAHISYKEPIIEKNDVIKEESPNDYLENNNLENEAVITAENPDDYLNLEENVTMDDTSNNEEITLVDDNEVSDVVEEEEYVDETVFSNISIDDVATTFQKYLNDNGVLLSILSIRTLLASVFSSRTVFISSLQHELLIKVLNCLNKFLGNDLKINDSNDFSNFAEMISKRENDVFEFTDVSNELVNAKKMKNHLSLMIFDHVTNDKIDLFDEFIKSSMSSLAHYINLNGQFEIPKNICFIYIFEDSSYLEEIPKKYLENATSIDLVMQKNELSSNNEDIDSISFSQIKQYLKEAVKNNYMDEDAWKKFDDFEDFMNQIEPDYKIKNKSALLLENLSSLMLALGVDMSDIVDELLCLHIIPLLKKTLTYKKENGIETIKNLLIKAFNEDNVAKAIVKLQKQNITSEKSEEKPFNEFNELFKEDNKIESEEVKLEQEDNEAELERIKLEDKNNDNEIKESSNETNTDELIVSDDMNLELDSDDQNEKTDDTNAINAVDSEASNEVQKKTTRKTTSKTGKKSTTAKKTTTKTTTKRTTKKSSSKDLNEKNTSNEEQNLNNEEGSSLYSE